MSSGSRISVVDARSPDTRDAVESAGQWPLEVALTPADKTEVRKHWGRLYLPAPVQGVADPLVDRRSPDARDAAFRAMPDVKVGSPALVSSDRFHWDDFGLGVGVVLGTMLLHAGLAAGVLAARKRHGERVGAATT